jgi:hypothetical protein
MINFNFLQFDLLFVLFHKIFVRLFAIFLIHDRNFTKNVFPWGCIFLILIIRTLDDTLSFYAIFLLVNLKRLSLSNLTCVIYQLRILPLHLVTYLNFGFVAIGRFVVFILIFLPRRFFKRLKIFLMRVNPFFCFNIDTAES